MKNIIIEIPKNGASVQLVLSAGASSGQAVIVTSDDVEIRWVAPPASPTARSKPAAKGKASKRNLDFILERLTKLKPTKRAAAVNCIKTMFRLTDPITDDDANDALEALRKRGSLTIDANDKLQLRNA